MPNPLILASGRHDLMLQMGRELRLANRQKEDEHTLRAAMDIFRRHLPEILEEPPSTDNFNIKWPIIDAEMAKELKSETAYRRAYSFICNKIEEGNRQGIWSIVTPPAYITLRRQRPLRTESWHNRTNQIANIAQQWQQRLLYPNPTPNQLFAQCLICGLLYGGLNRPALWPALAKTLIDAKPFQGNREFAWLTLQINAQDVTTTNYYRNENGQSEPQAISEVHYVPDPISMGLLRRFLLIRTNEWQVPKNIDDCHNLIEQELGTTLSITALHHGAISITEHLPGINLPQVLLEYAIGRSPSASLPSPYLQRLFCPDIHECSEMQYNHFNSIFLLNQVSNWEKTPFARSKRPFLLHKLKEIFHHDAARPVGKREIINQLNSINSPDLTLSEQVLLQWLLTHLTERDNAVSTAKAYLDSIGQEWIASTLLLPLDAYHGEEFCELYQSILNRPKSQKAREYKAGRLEDMHRFAVSRFHFEPLPNSLIESDRSIPHVSASVVDEPLFAALLIQVDQFIDIDDLQRRMLKSFLIMAYRTGLRPGEIAKLRLKDIEPSSIGWIFVRENCHGHNKTDAALRKVPLFILLTPEEHPTLTNYIGERRLLASTNSELIFHKQGNPRDPIDTKHLSLMVKKVLHDLSGGLYYRLYHLRHSALSRLQLLLHHDLTTLPAQLERTMLPYSAAQQVDILHLIAGKRRGRDRYMALAVFAGHSSPEITLSTYLHFTDLLLGCHLATNQQSISLADSRYFLGISTSKSTILIKQATITPARLRSYVLKRIGEFQSTIKQSRIAKSISLPALQESSHYLQSGAVLARYQSGHDYRDIAWFYGLKDSQVQRWYQSACQLRELITLKLTSRLFPKSRAHMIMPAEPNYIDEKQDVAKILAACQAMRKDPIQFKELKWAIKYSLLHCNSSRSGIRFSDPLFFNKFMAVVSQLLPWKRWRLKLHYPKGKMLSEWKCHDKLQINVKVLRKIQQFPDGLGILLLRHTNEKKRIAQGLEHYSSHSLRYVFHRLAIILFTASEIKRWQLTPLITNAWLLVDTIEETTLVKLHSLDQLYDKATPYEKHLLSNIKLELFDGFDPEMYDYIRDASTHALDQWIYQESKDIE
ncbi:site-specific integrase [Shewanella sp. TB7-MNA-CIBAN-0143]|uniref:site-specific integrase n=1 Tax=Shewanella sp. TB7-MNA-CIBAN-0143 TaxID=3140465 RepID=UPI00333245D9